MALKVGSKCPQEGLLRKGGCEGVLEVQTSGVTQYGSVAVILRCTVCRLEWATILDAGPTVRRPGSKAPGG